MSPAVDSAGQPFQGRSFQPNPFQGDTGLADPGLEAALQSFNQVLAGANSSAIDAAFTSVVHALHSARLLVPLMTEAGDCGVTDEGHVVEKSQELSIVHVEGPDGRAVAPLFSSVQAMSRWNAEARPVPVDSARAALATAAEGLALMVLDPGSAHSLTLRRSALRAIATSEPYVSPLLDQEVRAALDEGFEAHRQVVVSCEVRSGDLSHTLSGPEIVVAVSLVPDLTAEELSSLLESVSARWSENALLQARVDGLGIKVTPA